MEGAAKGWLAGAVAASALCSSGALAAADDWLGPPEKSYLIPALDILGGNDFTQTRGTIGFFYTLLGEDNFGALDWRDAAATSA